MHLDVQMLIFIRYRLGKQFYKQTSHSSYTDINKHHTARIQISTNITQLVYRYKQTSRSSYTDINKHQAARIDINKHHAARIQI